MLFLHLFKIMSVKGTVLVDTFVDAEELPVLFGNQGMTTVRTEDIFENGTAIAAPDGCDGLAILPLVVSEEKLPVLPNESLDDRELVHFKFLVFRRMGSVMSPLF